MTRGVWGGRASTAHPGNPYEAQVAGLPDSGPIIRAVKRASVADLARRRSRVVDAVHQVLGQRLELVNSGGSGSIETSGADPSGPSTRSRLPRPVDPHGLVLTSREGAGEVQTPLHGSGADKLDVGDRVWFRHAKAGEVMERFDAVHLVRGAVVERTVPTYRGEGRTFG
ncbi:MAG TPA: hypothetical protein VF413_00940 [Cellulomonas sp.]